MKMVCQREGSDLHWEWGGSLTWSAGEQQQLYGRWGNPEIRCSGFSLLTRSNDACSTWKMTRSTVKMDWPALRLNCWRCRSAIQSNRFKARGRYIGLKMFNTEHPSRRKRGTLWEDPWMYWRRMCSRLEWQRIGGDADDLTAETLDASLGSCLYTEQNPVLVVRSGSLRSLNFMFWLFLFSISNVGGYLFSSPDVISFLIIQQMCPDVWVFVVPKGLFFWPFLSWNFWFPLRVWTLIWASLL